MPKKEPQPRRSSKSMGSASSATKRKAGTRVRSPGWKSEAGQRRAAANTVNRRRGRRA